MVGVHVAYYTGFCGGVGGGGEGGGHVGVGIWENGLSQICKTGLSNAKKT